MKAFSAEEAEIGISSLAKRLGLAKSTVHRLAVTLAAEGFLEQNPDTGRYRLGLSLFTLGALARRRMDVSNVSRPLLGVLRDKFQEASTLAILSGTSIMFLHNLESGQAIGIRAHIGDLKPAHCTAEGRVLLAFSPPARGRRSAGRRAEPAHGQDAHRPGRMLKRALDEVRLQASRSTTKRAKTACAAWRRRCATSQARSLPRSAWRADAAPDARRTCAPWRPRWWQPAKRCRFGWAGGRVDDDTFIPYVSPEPTTTFECSEDDTLLRAAQRAGIGFPYECNVGSCGNCKFELVEGELGNGVACGARPERQGPRARRHLGCQSRPRSDCVIKLRPAERYQPPHPPQRTPATLTARACHHA